MAFVRHRNPYRAPGWLCASPCPVLGLQNGCRVAHPLVERMLRRGPVIFSRPCPCPCPQVVWASGCVHARGFVSSGWPHHRGSAGRGHCTDRSMWQRGRRGRAAGRRLRSGSDGGEAVRHKGPGGFRIGRLPTKKGQYYPRANPDVSGSPRTMSRSQRRRCGASAARVSPRRECPAPAT